MLLSLSSRGCKFQVLVNSVSGEGMAPGSQSTILGELSHSTKNERAFLLIRVPPHLIQKDYTLGNQSSPKVPSNIIPLGDGGGAGNTHKHTYKYASHIATLICLFIELIGQGLLLTPELHPLHSGVCVCGGLQ